MPVSEQPDYQTALQRETKARREAQGWCEHHQIYHRNFTCEHGAGIPLLNVRNDLLKKLEGPDTREAVENTIYQHIKKISPVPISLTKMISDAVISKIIEALK